MAANPMHQFNVYRIGPEIKIDQIDISFTNASLFMVISSIAIIIIFNHGSKKNIKINQGLVPNQLSKINPIIVPTATADTNSVLILNAVPMLELDLGFFWSLWTSALFFAIFKRDLNSSSDICPKQPCSLLFEDQQQQVGLFLFLAL